MNALIIDIRENTLRVILSNNDAIEYCRTFDFEPFASLYPVDDENAPRTVRKNVAAVDNPYLIYYDKKENNPWDQALDKIIKQVRSDISTSIDSTHLIIPTDEVIIDSHQLPVMPRQDALRLIGRKISAESKEEFPPFSIIPAALDKNIQTWYSLYIPSITIKSYHKAFSSCGLRLSSITTPINAMIDAFRSVREAIFNTHAVFEIQQGFIEAFYISAEGILHFQRLQYKSPPTSLENDDQDAERVQKQKIFNIINSIFSINSRYQSAHQSTPVQMAWVCGLVSGLDEIATALSDAMGIEVGIAPVMPTGLSDESGYVPLSGFASALSSNLATTYKTTDFFRRFRLRGTSGLIIYTVTTVAALLAFGMTERGYRAFNRQVKPASQVDSVDKQLGKTPASYVKNLERLKKLASPQFIFYNLFRELANELPDGVILENIDYQFKDDKGNITITALIPLDAKGSATELPGKMMALLDRSPALRNHREPTITTVTSGKEKFLKITCTSEVNQRDTKK